MKSMGQMLLCAALGVAGVVALPAQQAAGGYLSVACLKTKPVASPANGDDSRPPSVAGFHRMQQANLDSGKISAWFLLDAVAPRGTAAMCDRYSISWYPSPMPEPLETGVDVRLGAIFELVSWEMWRNRMAVGTMRKGDYVYFSRLKVTELEEWLENEKRVWQPMAAQRVKDEAMRGWYVSVPVFPGGSECRYQATTMDVFPDWETALASGMDVAAGQTFEYRKLRDVAVRELWIVDDAVTRVE